MNAKRLATMGLFLCLGLPILGVAASAWAYPEPAIVAKAWQLEFSHALPQTIAVRQSDGQYRWYWYMTYKATNRSGKEQQFFPEVSVATDDGRIVQANRNVPDGLFETIKKHTGNELLEDPLQTGGMILIGEDQSKESVAIWPVSEKPVKQMTLFIAGLSGEIQIIQNPDTGEKVTLRKTLMIDYKLPGSPVNPQQLKPEPAGEKWVMR